MTFECTINGKIYRVREDISPRTSLLQYLRNYLNLKGTKGFCYEGGCGTCTVVATFVDPETGKRKTICLKSCLSLIYSCAGWDIETIENLGNRYSDYHQTQKAMVGFGGTQCGICSPGFIMTMYGELKSKKGTLTKKEAEDALDGNLCRCTGYRPILDAFKSLAVDASSDLVEKLRDIEEWYKPICSKTGEACLGKCPRKKGSGIHGCSSKGTFLRKTRSVPGSITGSLPESIPKSSSDSITGSVPESIPDSIPGSVPGAVPASIPDSIPGSVPESVTAADGIIWKKPTTLQNLYEIIIGNTDDKTLQMVNGNTGSGVYRSEATPDVYVDISSLQELFSVEIGRPLTIGANVSMERCIEIFREVATNYEGYEYLNEFADHWANTANTTIRKVGSWAGNLMIKHQHKEFRSDIFVTLAVADAVIKIGNAVDGSTFEFSVEDLMEMDMSKGVIISMKLLPIPQNVQIRTYRIAERWVNAAAYVISGFKFEVDPRDGFRVLTPPSLVYGGISSTFNRATKTETELVSKALNSEATIQAAMKTLAEEILPEEDPLNSSTNYRVSLSQALFYKAILSILGNDVEELYRSGGVKMVRPLSTGKQYYDLNKDSWPVGQAVPKLEANTQASGEAEYVDDMMPLPGELHGVFVQSTVGRAKLGSVDPSEALKLSGVVGFVESKDIPGLNSFYPNGDPDVVFVRKNVQYYGQSIGLIVATSRSMAESAARLVKITYTDIQKPVIGFGKKETVKFEGSPEEVPFDHTDGEFNILEGGFENGTQFHFPLEPLAARVVPVEDGYDVFCTTQYPTLVHTTLTKVLGIHANSLNISVKRIGGGFGGKISRPNLVASAAAVAAHKLQKPVRITLDLSTHMSLVGWRDPYYIKYKVQFNNEGIFQMVDIKLTSDPGYLSNETSSDSVFGRVPNVYYSPKWNIDLGDYNTNTAASTSCRAPGTPFAIASSEDVIERIAAFLKKDPLEIREKNFFIRDKHQDQPIKPRGENLVRTRIFPLLKQESDYLSRRTEIETFNKMNRWRKRGISMTPMYYSHAYPKALRYSSQVIIYRADGMVVLSHGGIEMGQGLNTKVVQVAAKTLKIPVSFIKIKAAHSLTGANSTVTSGSYGSDLVSHATLKSCEKLRLRIDVIYNEMKEKNHVEPTWPDLVEECYQKNVDLTERFWTAFNNHPGSYDIFGAACMEVELDVLTGQYMMLRADLIEDVGQSLNPYVDIGQVEGAFIFGLGLYTTERVVFDYNTGQKLNNRALTYKPPTAMDIPVDFRVTLLPKGDNEHGVLRSKATGEPAVCLGYCVVTALRHAITSARADAGLANWFAISTPLTVEKAKLLCGTNVTDFQLKKKKTQKSTSCEQLSKKK